MYLDTKKVYTGGRRALFIHPDYQNFVLISYTMLSNYTIQKLEGLSTELLDIPVDQRSAKPQEVKVEGLKKIYHFGHQLYVF